MDQAMQPETRHDKLRALWGWLSEWQQAHPSAEGPSFREVQEAMQYSSVSIAMWWLEELWASGYISMDPRKERTIHVLVPLLRRMVT